MNGKSHCKAGAPSQNHASGWCGAVRLRNQKFGRPTALLIYSTDLNMHERRTTPIQQTSDFSPTQPPFPIYIERIKTQKNACPSARSIIHEGYSALLFTLLILNSVFGKRSPAMQQYHTSCKKAQTVARRLIRLYSARSKTWAGSACAHFNIQTGSGSGCGRKPHPYLPSSTRDLVGCSVGLTSVPQLFVVNTTNYRSIKALHTLKLRSI